jgi:alkylation response protein AidB-like acyl-CoA dehydrogenase
MDSLIDIATTLSAQFAENASQHDSSGIFPDENFSKLYDKGLMSLTVARSAGGYGATLEQSRRVVSELAKGDGSTALAFAMHAANHAVIANGHWWPPCLARLVTETNRAQVALINRLQVEPGGGAPSYGVQPATRAEYVAEGWRITGRKCYATGAPALTWLLVSASTNEDYPRAGFFLIPGGAKGVSVKETWDVVGMRASGSHDIILDRVIIPHSYCLQMVPTAEGVRRDDFYVSWFMVLIAAVYHGLAQTARDHTLAFVKRYAPVGLGQPLSNLPRIRDELGALELLLQVNERLLQSVAFDTDHGRSVGADATAMRHVVIENAAKVLGGILSVTGNYSLRRGNPLERIHRDVLCGVNHAPSGPRVREAAAARILGALT